MGKYQLNLCEGFRTWTNTVGFWQVDTMTWRKCTCGISDCHCLRQEELQLLPFHKSDSNRQGMCCILLKLTTRHAWASLGWCVAICTISGVRAHQAALLRRWASPGTSHNCRLLTPSPSCSVGSPISQEQNVDTWAAVEDARKLCPLMEILPSAVILRRI